MEHCEIKEIWEDIEGYEGLYQVSNYGNVKSQQRLRWNGKGWCIQKECIMSQRINTSGYKIVVLCKDGVKRVKIVHRLVAYAFIPNLNNFPEVNHKNEIKTDNRAENLEWCTKIYNQNYGTKKIRTQITRKKLNSEWNALMKKNKNHSYGAEKPVLCYLKDGTFVNRFRSLSVAAQSIGDCTSHIADCCNGRRKSVRGYNWRHEDN